MRRALLRWLLFSPRRLACVVLVMLVVGIALVQLSHLAAQPPSAPPAGPPVTGVEPPPAPPPAPGSEPLPPPPVQAPVPEPPPREAARRFAQLWVDTDVSPRVWLTRLQPLCTDEYGSVVLPQVDPADIPSTRLTGEVRLVRNSSRNAEVEVGLDHDVTIAVELVDVSGGGTWRVASVADADTIGA